MSYDVIIIAVIFGGLALAFTALAGMWWMSGRSGRVWKNVAFATVCVVLVVLALTGRIR